MRLFHRRFRGIMPGVREFRACRIQIEQIASDVVCISDNRQPGRLRKRHGTKAMHRTARLDMRRAKFDDEECLVVVHHRSDGYPITSPALDADDQVIHELGAGALLHLGQLGTSLPESSNDTLTSASATNNMTETDCRHVVNRLQFVIKEDDIQVRRWIEYGVAQYCTNTTDVPHMASNAAV